MVNLRRVLSLICFAFVLTFASACTKIEPGYAGIIINNMGSSKGIQDTPVVTGFQWYSPFTEEVHVFPTFQQRVIWAASPEEGDLRDQSITVNSTEGAQVSLDVSVSLTFEQSKIPHIFGEYRIDPSLIIDGFVRDRARSALAAEASGMKVVDIFGPGRSVLEAHAFNKLHEELASKGILVGALSITGLRVSDEVKTSIQAVVTNQQRANAAEAAVRQKEAEAAQKVAEASGDAEATRLQAYGRAESMNLETAAQANQITELGKANAEAARLMQQQITDELVEYQKAQRWDGKLPQYNLGSTSTFMSLPAAVHAAQ